MRVILHAGTPKTGSTALQMYLRANDDALAAAGIWMPAFAPGTTRHQQLVAALRSPQPDAFAHAFAQLVDARPASAQTDFLSAEGVYLHWFDAPASAHASFARALARVGAEMELWVCLREPRTFAESLYAQNLRNPVADPLHARDASLDAMLDEPRFREQLDYARFVRDMDALLGAERVRLFRYDREIVAHVARALGLADGLGDAHASVLPSLRSAGIEVQRVLNRYPLTGDARAAAVQLAADLDAALGDASPPFCASEAAAMRIERLFGSGWLSLQPRLDAAPR